MQNKPLMGLLAAIALGLSGCGGGSGECGAKLSLEHDLSSMFDDDCNFDSCMGEDGSDFRIAMAPISQTVSDSTCDLMPDGQDSDSATVEREGDVLTISLGFQELVLNLSGNDLSTEVKEFDDGACQNTMNNIQGSLDYTTRTLVWSYYLTVTDLGGCF